MKAIDRLMARLAETGVSEAQFARNIGETQQVIHNWKKRGLPSGRTVALAQELGLRPEYLASGELPMLSQLYAYAIKSDRDPVSSGENLVEVLEVEVGAGDGKECPDFVATKYKQTYRQEFLDSCGVRDSSRVKIMRVRGPSMQRVLFDGDKVTFHMDDTKIVDGRMYVILVANQLKVKYLRMRRDGGVTIISENKEDWPAEEVPIDEMHSICILGRVIDKSGRGGLG